MKIAATAYGNHPEAMIDPHFRAAGHLLAYDVERKAWEAYSIQRERNKGWSESVAGLVREVGTNVLLTGLIDASSFKLLTACGVEIYIAQEMEVREAVESYFRGELCRLLYSTAVNVDGLKKYKLRTAKAGPGEGGR